MKFLDNPVVLVVIAIVFVGGLIFLKTYGNKDKGNK